MESTLTIPWRTHSCQRSGTIAPLGYAYIYIYIRMCVDLTLPALTAALAEGSTLLRQLGVAELGSQLVQEGWGQQITLRLSRARLQKRRVRRRGGSVGWGGMGWGGAGRGGVESRAGSGIRGSLRTDAASFSVPSCNSPALRIQAVNPLHTMTNTRNSAFHPAMPCAHFSPTPGPSGGLGTWVARRYGKAPPLRRRRARCAPGRAKAPPGPAPPRCCSGNTRSRPARSSWKAPNPQPALSPQP